MPYGLINTIPIKTGRINSPYWLVFCLFSFFILLKKIPNAQTKYLQIQSLPPLSYQCYFIGKKHLLAWNWPGFWLTKKSGWYLGNAGRFDYCPANAFAWLLGFFNYNSYWLQYMHPSLLLLFIIPFILFRFFDIIKPFPIKWVDKNVSGGFGILIDDILAGIMAMIIMINILFFVV